MTKFKIKDVDKYMVEIYEVEAETKEKALDEYINKLAGSLEIIDCYYDPDAEDTIEVLDY